MSKILNATCENNVVKVGTDIVDATIMTQGKAASNGIVLIDEDRKQYLTANSTDLATAINKIASALSTVASALTAIGGGMTGGTTAPPGSLGTSVSSINSAVSDLNALKVNLK